MLTKETKQKAEEIRATLAPLFATAEKLGAKLQKAAKETRQAHKVAIAWQYPTVKGYAEEAGEDFAKIQATRNENAKEWHNILNGKYLTLNKCEIAENCARLNYRNYLAYICDTLAHLLHVGDTWAQFYEKKGIESITDLLREKAPIYIYRDGAGFAPFGQDNFYCYLKINFWGVCSVRASSWGTFAETKKGDRREWKQPTEPKTYTVAQYCHLIKELKRLEAEAIAKAREHHEKARASGLVYFVGGLSDPQLKVWGKND